MKLAAEFVGSCDESIGFISILDFSSKMTQKMYALVQSWLKLIKSLLQVNKS